MGELPEAVVVARVVSHPWRCRPWTAARARIANTSVYVLRTHPYHPMMALPPRRPGPHASSWHASMDGAPTRRRTRCAHPAAATRGGPATGHAMHCRDCGAELLGLDPTTCRSCGARLVTLHAVAGDDFGPGLADGAVLRAVILVAGLGAALTLGAIMVDVVV